MRMKYPNTGRAASTLLVAGFLCAAGMDTAEAKVLTVCQQKSGGTVNEPSKTRPSSVIDLAAAATTVSVSDADNGKTVLVPVGCRLVVRLASNITTGYLWRVVTGNPAHLRQDGEATYDSPDAQLLGAGGTQVFTFTALEADRTQLVLEYIRPWEANALRRFTVIVHSPR
jgi:inhibitor of cysteine peptidase